MKFAWKNTFFLLLILFVVLAGCSSQSSNQNQSPDNSNDKTSGTDETSSPASSHADKDTLIIGLDDDPPQLDPHKSSAAVDRQVFQSLYNTLVDIDEELNFKPELAKSWEISDDGKTYTFKLQEGVKFQDGTPFNAEAVKFNFERMLDPELASPRKSEINLVKEVKVVDEYTVKILLKKPYSPFLAALADRAGMMVSPTAVKQEGKDFSNHPVGTGPYKFVERVQQDHIKLTRFDDYWRGKPAIKNVVYKPFPDGNTRVTNIISGNIDMLNRIPYKDVEKLKGKDNIKLSIKPGIGFQGLMLNTDKAPFNNKKVRQAINIAIDRAAIAKVVFRGGVVPAVSPFAPSSWANPEDMEIPKANPEKAKQLLSESGLSNIHFTLKINPKPQEKQIGQMLQSMLSAVGIKVDLELVEFGTMLDQMFAGDYQALRIGWSGRIDPNGDTFTWFTTNGSLNSMGYSNPKVDQLLKEARTISDRAERKAKYDKVSQILWDEVPYVFLYHPKNIITMKKYVEGFNHVPDGMIRTETIHFK
ncbi:MAG TPA: ABC transporter substrate-binding protein [Bacillales bacterium]|nr:ABC transporter substrate-binding protein [Bacillales bacterium]